MSKFSDKLKQIEQQSEQAAKSPEEIAAEQSAESTEAAEVEAVESVKYTEVEETPAEEVAPETEEVAQESEQQATQTFANNRKAMTAGVMRTVHPQTICKITNLVEGAEEGYWLFREYFFFRTDPDSVMQDTMFVFVNPNTYGTWMLKDRELHKYAIQPGKFVGGAFEPLPGWEFEDD